MADLSQYITEAQSSIIWNELHAKAGYDNPRESFRDELANAGFTPPPVIEIGRLQRITAPNDKQGKKSGWLSYNETADNQGKVLGIGVYGSWNGNPERVVWTSRSTSHMTAEERWHYQQQIDTAKAHTIQAQAERQQEAKVKAQAIWDKGIAANPAHPYLVKKQVKALNIKQSLVNNSLLIPVIEPITESIVSLQFIHENGEKRFLSGGRKKGCFFKIDGHTAMVLIAEGYSTAATLHEATGAIVYVAFDAGNLYEVASHVKQAHPNTRIIICADDDKHGQINTGATKALQATEALGLELMLPDPAIAGTDFNDMAAELGLDAVKNLFITQDNGGHKVYDNDKRKLKTAKDLEVLHPTGILGEVVNYYNATSGNKQPTFAVQTAIALCSIVCARHYETNYNNRSSIYLINIGKSGTGKEHAKSTVERILRAANLDKQLIGGDAYTSDAAVISALVERPRHITIIDELAKNLQAANNKLSNGQLAAANSKLVEAFSRLDGVMRPKSYSTIGLSKDKAKAMLVNVVNPAITILSMTTPDDFFNTINLAQVKDGFLNRFLINISDAERCLRTHRERIDVPQNIIDWCKAVQDRAGGGQDEPTLEPNLITLSFNADALNLEREFQEWCIAMADKLEKLSLSEMVGRSNEMAMRLSLIHALSRNVNAEIIEAQDIAWGIAWVKFNLDVLISAIKMNISSSEFEASKLECLKAIRAKGEQGITFKEMQVAKPFSKYRKKDMQEILDALLSAELIIHSERKTGGRPISCYMAIE